MSLTGTVPLDLRPRLHVVAAYSAVKEVMLEDAASFSVDVKSVVNIVLKEIFS